MTDPGAAPQPGHAAIAAAFAALYEALHQAVGTEARLAQVRAAAARAHADPATAPLAWFLVAVEHRVARGGPAALVQLAYADGSASPVASAASALEPPEAWTGRWLRQLGRPPLAHRGACLRTIELAQPLTSIVLLPPDGRCAVVAGFGNELVVLDLVTGERVARIARKRPVTLALAALPDGRRVLAGGSALEVWDVARGRRERALAGHAGSVNAVAVDPAGRLALSGGADGTARLWDLATGAQLASLAGDGGAIAAVALDADGRRAATVTSSGPVNVWDVATRARVCTLGDGAVRGWLALAFDPAGRLLVGSFRADVQVFDPATGRVVARYETHKQGGTRALALDPARGAALLFPVGDHTIAWWDHVAGARVGALHGHATEATAVAFHGGGRHAASVDRAGAVKLWRLDPDAAASPAAAGHDEAVRAMAVDVAARRVVSGSEDGTARAWDADAASCLGALGDAPESILGVLVVAVHPRLGLVATCVPGGTVGIYDLASRRRVAEYERLCDGVDALCWHPTEPRALAGGCEAQLALWDLAAGKRLAVLPGAPRRVHAAAFLPDGRRAVASGSDGFEICLWDVDAGAVVRALRGHRNAVHALVPLAGERVASASADGTLGVWDLATGGRLAELRGHATGVRALAACGGPDGARYLVSGGEDKTLRVWDLAAGGACVARWDADAEVTAVAALPARPSAAVPPRPGAPTSAGASRGAYRTPGAVAPSVAPPSHVVAFGDSTGAVTFVEWLPR